MEALLGESQGKDVEMTMGKAKIVLTYMLLTLQRKKYLS